MADTDFEWTRGEPCPNCENNGWFVWTEERAEEVQFDGTGEVEETGDLYGAECLSITCAECWTVLEDHEDGP